MAKMTEGLEVPSTQASSDHRSLLPPFPAHESLTVSPTQGPPSRAEQLAEQPRQADCRLQEDSDSDRTLTDPEYAESSGDEDLADAEDPQDVNLEDAEDPQYFNLEDTQDPLDFNLENAQDPLDFNLENVQDPLDFNLEDAQDPLDFNLENAQDPLDFNLEDTQDPLDFNLEDAQDPLVFNLEDADHQEFNLEDAEDPLDFNLEDAENPLVFNLENAGDPQDFNLEDADHQDVNLEDAMAPSATRGQRESSVDETEEYRQFIAELKEYHTKRGTTFDPQPKVGTRRVDLLRVFKLVIEKGGYDEVGKHKLAWRGIGEVFGLGSHNLAALAFTMKTIYYRNLAAYEISTIHGKEPPPKEILEDVSAAGGDLLNRTLENFKRPGSRDMINGNEAASTNRGQRTPERMDTDEPGSGGRTRSLRQQPAQRVPWQPDTSTPRQNRNISAHTNSPQPQVMPSNLPLHPSSDPNSAMFQIQNWSGSSKPLPLTVQPVPTPRTNYELFKQKRIQELRASLGKTHASPAEPIAPKPLKTVFSGPNIYIRCLMGLRCPIREEQQFALHHLVKISHERGDKFKFSSFPGLAQALLNKALEVSSLFYKVEWVVVYNERDMKGPNYLDGAYGTIDILDRIKAHPRCDSKDGIRTKEWTENMQMMNETGLVLRNLVMMEDNAVYLSKYGILRDIACIALNLPNLAESAEFKGYLLDILEQVITYWMFTPPLWESLVAQLMSPDRGILLRSIQCLNRASLNLEVNNLMTSPVPIETLTRIINLIHTNDEEVVSACLDFLYQYTAYGENVEMMLKKLRISIEVIPRLISLLMYDAKSVFKPVKVQPPASQAAAAADIPEFPKELLVQIAAFPEPNRSVKWLQCCFEENERKEVTQIHLWQSYQNSFSGLITPQGGPMLQASDFIKRVSNTFPGANAQVVTVPEGPRFIIRGIQPRKRPVDLSGREIRQCVWKVNGHPCKRIFFSDLEGGDHIFKDHLHLQQDEEGRFLTTKEDAAKYICQWPDCTHPYYTKPTEWSHCIVNHVRTHFGIEAQEEKARAALAEQAAKPPSPGPALYRNTASDKGQPAGLPYTSVLILKNLARYANRLEDGNRTMDDIFLSSRRKLFDVFAYNMTLSRDMGDLILMVDGMAKPKS